MDLQGLDGLADQSFKSPPAQLDFTASFLHHPPLPLLDVFVPTFSLLRRRVTAFPSLLTISTILGRQYDSRLGVKDSQLGSNKPPSPSLALS